MSVAEPVLSKVPVSRTPTRKSSTTSNTSRSPSKLTTPSNSVITPATNFDGVMNATTKLIPGSSNNSGGADKQANNVINGHTPNTKASSHTATRHNSTNRGSKQMRKDQPNIGKYKLIRTLGRGNFAKVKLAEHVTTGQQVAVKVIDKTELNSASLQKLSREVKIMKMLNHPNIVRLYEVIESERHVYLVIEYAPNGEVFDFLVTNGRMKEKEARVKFRQLVSAVEYCHSKKIVHRDLKAENLLLDKDYNIKLCDFGFSNFFDGSNKLDTFCGSPPYAAPELFQGQKYYGPEVDIWSLGVILYTLVSGSLPFDAQTLKDLQTRVIRGKYRVPFYMSSECELLLRKLLVLNPSKRKPLGTIMSDKWMNLGFDDALEPYSEPLLDYNDPERISLMESLGFQASEVREALEKQLFNNVTAIYLLLADPRARKNLLTPNSSKRPKVRMIQSSDTMVNNTIEEDGVTNEPASATITTTRSSSPHSSSDATRSPLVDDSPTKKTKTDIKVITTPSVEINGLSNAGVSTPIDRKVGVSWMKQSISAGPAPSGRTEKVKVEGSPPSHLSTETAQTVEGDDISPGDSAWLRRTNTFTTKPMRQMTGTDQLSPEQLQQPLTRAAQYSDIPNHLSSGPRDGSQMECSASQRYDSRTLLEEREDETLRAHPVEQPHITPAIPYRKYENPTFSCHRPRTEPGGTATPTTAPIARIDPKLKSEAVDMLDPIARHQFARNCPERATVAVGQVHKKRLHSKAPPPAPAQQINSLESASSYSTASRVDISDGSSNNTLNSDSACRRRNNTPTALITEPDTDLTLTTLVTSLKSATDSPLHRDTKMTISARYRSPGVNNSRPQPSVDIVPVTPAVEYDARSERRPFIRRLTTQLSKRFRRSRRRRAAADTDVTPIVKHEPATPTANTQAADNPSVVQHHGDLDASPNPWTARRPPRKQSMPVGESAHLTYLESDDALPSGGAHSNDLGRDDEPFFLDSQSRTVKHAHPNDAIHQRRTFTAEHHSPKPRRLTPFFHRLPIYGTEPLELLNNAMHVLDMNRITYSMENDYCLLCTNVSNQPAIFNPNPSNLSPGTTNNDDPSAAHVPTVSVSTADEMVEEKTHLIDADSNKNNNDHIDTPSIQWRIEVFRIGKRYGIRFKHSNGNVHDFKQMEKFLAPQFKVK